MSLLDRELVVFSPLPPRRSGIASYTAELLGELGRHRRVVVVVEQAADIVDLPGVMVTCQAAYLVAGWLRALPHLYQLGNNADHAFVYRACLQRPGVLVLHDPVLHHLIEEMTLGQDKPAGYETVMQYCHGPAGLLLAQLHQAGLFSDQQRYRMPLHAEVVGASRGVLVHSAYAAARVRGTGPTGQTVPVRVLRHHVSPLVLAHDGLTQAGARSQLGLSPEVAVLLSLGFVTKPKQIELILRALALLHAAGLDFRYVIGGEAGSQDLLPLIESLGLRAVVQTTGYLAESAFFTYARAADLLINLRFPIGGETSGTLTRALGMGLPALVFDHGPAAEWPDDVVFKLPFCGNSITCLAHRLGLLLADRRRLVEQGWRAKHYARMVASLAGSTAATLTAVDDWCVTEALSRSRLS